MATHSPSEKQKLRQAALQVRASLPVEEINQAICQHLEQSSLFAGAAQILSYVAVRQELTLQPLMEKYPEKAWFLPRVESAGERSMGFYGYQPGSPLAVGAYGIPEPDPSGESWVFSGQPTMVLVPGVMYDRLGYRLGYGKGFYDKFLGGLPPACVTVGVVPQALLTDILPADEWDRPVQWLVSEEKMAPVPVLA